MKKEEWFPSNGIELEFAAINAIKNEKNTLVIAGPGAGKTELLAQKAGYLLSTDSCKFPKKILAISFKKDAAINLKERILNRYGEKYKDRFFSYTYDGFFKNILDRFHRALPEYLKLNPKYEIADKEKLQNTLYQSGYKEIINLNPNEFTKKIEKAIKGTTFPIRIPKYKNFWDIMMQGNEKSKAALSFLMIARLVLLIIKTNPFIKKLIDTTFSHVFLDEFQDTTDIQYSIIKSLFMNTDVKLTAVGDNKQRIMLWAGAKKTVFNDFKNDFEASIFNLLMNHRSAPRLVELQKNMYESLKENPKNIVYSEKWDKDDGIVNLIISENEEFEANKILELILSDISNGIKPNDIAILCKQRVENYSKALINVFKENGIQARIENDYQDLLKEEIIRVILNIMLLSKNRERAKEWEYIISLSEEIFGDMNTSKEKYYQMLNKLESLFKNISDILLKTKSLEDIYLLLETIISFFGEDKLKAYFPEYKQDSYFQDQLNRFADLMWKEYEIANKNWDKAIVGFKGENSIPIMTIHKSKGLEYSSVYFIGLEDSAFWNFKNQPEEDRCSFFVALSRAKKIVTFTYCKIRTNFRFPKQKTTNINEFYELLKKDNMANVIYAN